MKLEFKIITIDTEDITQFGYHKAMVLLPNIFTEGNT